MRNTERDRWVENWNILWKKMDAEGDAKKVTQKSKQKSLCPRRVKNIIRYRSKSDTTWNEAGKKLHNTECLYSVVVECVRLIWKHFGPPMFRLHRTLFKLEYCRQTYSSYAMQFMLFRCIIYILYILTFFISIKWQFVTVNHHSHLRRFEIRFR